MLFVLREEMTDCLDFWVLSQEQGTQWHSPEDTRLTANREQGEKETWQGGLKCASPSRNSQNRINLGQREKTESSDPLSCFYQISKD